MELKKHSEVTYFPCLVDKTMSGETTTVKAIKK